jgi:hypothetical protein
MASIIINNEELRNTLYYVSTIRTTLNKELDQVRLNKSHLNKFVPDYLNSVYSQNYGTALNFIDNVFKIAQDSAIVILVATFEQIVFAKYRTSYGALKVVVRDKTDSSIDYYDSRERFIFDSIGRLSGIFDLIKGKIDSDLYNILFQIKEYRNYIAHGKRFEKPPDLQLELEEIAKILDEVLLKIENNSNS